MVHDPFQLFISLVLFDRKILQLQKKIQDAAEVIGKVQKEKDILDIKDEKFKKLVHDAKKNVDTKELEMKELDEKEKAEKQKFDLVKNQREHDSIKKELEKVNQLQQIKEKEVVEAWNVFENSKKDRALFAATYLESVDNLLQTIQNHQDEMKSLETELESMLKERAEKEKGVDPDHLERYEIIKNQVADPVVPVENGCCSACFFHVSQSDMIAVSKRKMMQCKDCYRLLFLETLSEK